VRKAGEYEELGSEVAFQALKRQVHWLRASRQPAPLWVIRSRMLGGPRTCGGSQAPMAPRMSRA
jgi:hypothetical protein